MAKYTTTTVTTLHCPSCDSDKVIKARQARRPPALPLQELQEGIPFERQHPGRRFPPEQVGAALGMFYNGMSYKQIAENMEDMFDIPEPSKATVYEWVRDYSARALESMKRHRARTGDEWVADELVVRVGGQKYWLFNLMDTRTRYILAAHLSKYRGASAARDLMRKGAANAVNLPKTIKTDHLRSYISAIKDQFGADVKHVQSDGIMAEVNNNLSERLQGTFRARTKTLRGLDSRATGQAYLDAWVLSYNLFREHEALGNRTPAEVAKVHAPFKSWEEAVERTGPKRAIPQVEVVAAPKRETSSKSPKVAVDTEKVSAGLKPERTEATGRSRAKAAVKSRTPKRTRRVRNTTPYHAYLRRSELRRSK